MITSEDLYALLAQGESDSLELKTNIPAPDKLAKLLSSLSNTKGGTVVVGVREPNNIVGTDIERFSKYVGLARCQLHGRLDVEYYPIAVEGKTLGIIEVRPAELPIATSEGYFKRVGEQDVLIGASQLATEFSSVSDPSAAITALTETISAQSSQIEQLRVSFEKANSMRVKFFFIILGAIIGGVVRMLMPVIWDYLDGMVKLISG